MQIFFSIRGERKSHVFGTEGQVETAQRDDEKVSQKVNFHPWETLTCGGKILEMASKILIV